MNNRTRKPILWAVLMALLVTTQPCSAKPSMSETAPRPIIMIHGLGGSPAKTWGWGQKNGFSARLVAAGYEPHKTLFAFDYSDRADGDFTLIARDLPEIIDLALRKSGHSCVDLLAHSMGGLVARHYITSEFYRDDVANLLSLCAPNRGSFAATAALMEEYALGLRDLPADVYEDCSDRYGALYAEYTASRMWEDAPVSTNRTFEEWIAQSNPSVLDELMEAASLDDYLRVEKNVPDPESGLTHAYFQYLTLQLARRAHIQDHTLGKSPGVLARLVESIKGAAERLFYAGVARTVNIRPGTAALMRLVEEFVRIPTARADGRYVYEDLLANWYLRRWNEQDETARTTDVGLRVEPRYINMAVESPNLAGLVWQSVGPNDVAVELESVYLKPGPLDVYELFNSAAATHVSLLAERALPASIGRMLNAQEEELAVLDAGVHSLALSDWQPVCFAVPPDANIAMIGAKAFDPGVRLFLLDALNVPSAHALAKGPDTVSLFSARLEPGILPHLIESTATAGFEVVLEPFQHIEPVTDIPLVVVKQDKSTTRRRAIYDDGYTLLWNFGDGDTAENDIAEAMAHVYSAPGTYRARAMAKNEWDETTSKWEWLVNVLEAGQSIDFDLPIPFIPEPIIVVEGPQKWVTGRPAWFSVRVSGLLPNASVSRIDPGEQFSVVWAKPDRHRVRVAVTVKYVFEFEGLKLTVTRTYPAYTTVDVMAFNTAG